MSSPDSHPPISPLQQALRQATRSLHQRIDHHPLLSPLVRPGLTPSTYGRALQALHPVQRALEERLRGFDASYPHPIDYRLARLEADLCQLGLAPLPPDRDFPQIDTPSAWLGCYYVFAGANLGGRVIQRVVEEQLGSQVPQAYFKGTGADGGAAWQQLWQFAEARFPEPTHGAVAASAAAVFAAVAEQLDSGAERLAGD